MVAEINVENNFFNMLNRLGNRNFKPIIGQIALFAIGLIVLVLISIPLARNVSQRYKINQEIKDLENEIKVLQKQNSGLKDFVDYLGSQQFVEEQARLNLGLKKAGEEVAVIKTDDAEHSTSTEPQINVNEFFDIKFSPEPKKISNAIKWRKYFFKY